MALLPTLILLCRNITGQPSTSNGSGNAFLAAMRASPRLLKSWFTNLAPDTSRHPKLDPTADKQANEKDCSILFKLLIRHQSTSPEGFRFLWRCPIAGSAVGPNLVFVLRLAMPMKRHLSKRSELTRKCGGLLSLSFQLNQWASKSPIGQAAQASSWDAKPASPARSASCWESQTVDSVDCGWLW